MNQSRGIALEGFMQSQRLFRLEKTMFTISIPAYEHLVSMRDAFCDEEERRL
jgi:hypothetical protein